MEGVGHFRVDRRAMQSLSDSRFALDTSHGSYTA